ncbi:MAG: peptidoglycan editing factor PgeF [Bacillota bacterium]|nr:peptidoglycan editing factor PgeF [Bacillota bacterium]
MFLPAEKIRRWIPLHNSYFPETEQIRGHLSPEGLLWYDFPIFDPFREDFIAGFSSCRGGGGKGLDLNPKLEDRALLRENCSRFCRALGIPLERIVFSRQTHTTNLLEVDQQHAGQGLDRPREFQDIDGLLTRTEELPLFTFYADCCPLLFYAADQRIAAAAHAGWRGTVADMAGCMLRRLQSLGAKPRAIYAAIGPSAGPCCYQIDEGTAAHFRSIDASTLRPDPAAPGKFLADLWQANFLLLRRAGLPEQNIAISRLCTICNPDSFYSYRVQGNARGTLAAAVMLRRPCSTPQPKR